MGLFVLSDFPGLFFVFFVVTKWKVWFLSRGSWREFQLTVLTAITALTIVMVVTARTIKMRILLVVAMMMLGLASLSDSPCSSMLANLSFFLSLVLFLFLPPSLLFVASAATVISIMIVAESPVQLRCSKPLRHDASEVAAPRPCGTIWQSIRRLRPPYEIEIFPFPFYTGRQQRRDRSAAWAYLRRSTSHTCPSTTRRESCSGA